MKLQLFCGEVIIADTLPVLMVVGYVIVDGLSILEMLITWWTVIIFTQAKVDVTHVPPHSI